VPVDTAEDTGGGGVVGGGSVGPIEPEPAPLPQFPWPPPEASATVDLTWKLLHSHGEFSRLGEVNDVLKRALWRAGYSTTSYLQVPRGFALVTRIEQIEPNGQPMPSPARWSIAPSKLSFTGFSMTDYLRALFTSNPGHYRVIVFIVTDAPVTRADRPVSKDDTDAWLRQGSTALPPGIAAQGWTSATICSAFIYEFIREDKTEPKILLPGRIEGTSHLRPVLWAALGLG
jgi:hypothetical protein